MLFLISTPLVALNNWSYMSCDGRDTTGQYIYLFAYSDSATVNINGSILQIVGRTRNGEGVVTETFIATSGVVVYDSIVPTSNNTLNIYQFNAVTEALLARASLYCRFSGNNLSTLSVSKQKIFEKIDQK